MKIRKSTLARVGAVDKCLDSLRRQPGITSVDLSR